MKIRKENKVNASHESRPHVCPWWMAYTFDNPLRRVIHPPEKILAGYVGPAMTVMDLGCGFGHFSIGMAKMVKDSGLVIAIDVQARMLKKTMARASKKGVGRIIRPQLADGNDLGVKEPVDFVLASNVLHEVFDLPASAGQIASLLKPGGFFYVMEPAGHVGEDKFEREIDSCRAEGLLPVRRPKVPRERCAVLQKPGAGTGQ